MESLAVYEATPTENTALQAYSYDQLIEAFLASLDLKPRTIDTYKKGLRYFFAWIKDQGITNPTRSDIKAYKNSLLDAYTRPATVSAYMAPVRCFFRWISRESGKPELNIAADIRSPKQTKTHKRDALTADQAKHVLEVMPCQTVGDKRNRAIVTLMLHAALRDIEVVRLSIKDFYTTNEGAFIDVWGKGRDYPDRAIKVSRAPYDAIRDYLNSRYKQDGKPTETAPLFASLSNRDYGQRLNERTVSQIGKNALKAAGYDSPRLTAHSFRHTAITLVRQNGGTLDEAQRLARHENPATTQIYDHTEQVAANKAVDVLAQALAV